MEKLVTIQWLRGIAAVLVAWMHCIYLVSAREMSAFQIEWAHLYEWGAVGVDIFFVISGFIVTLTAARSTSVRSFMVNRIKRIWPLYALATLILIAIAPTVLQSPWHVVASLAFLAPTNIASPMPVLGPGWSLTYEMAFYSMICAALLWRTSNRVLPERILIVVTSLVVAAATFRFVPPLNVLGNPLSLEFAFGVAIGWLWLRRSVVPAWMNTALFVSGTVLLLYTALYGFGSWFYAEYAIKGPASWERVRVWGFPAALLVASAVFRQQPPQSRCRILTGLGDASYSIYLFHAIVVLLLDRYDGWMDGLQGDVIILVATAASVSGGVVAYYVIEQPLMKLLRRQPGRMSPSAEVA